MGIRMKHPNADPEFELSRLIDGDLPADEADRLRDRLAADPMLAEAHRKLARVDALVRAAAGPVPDVDWQQWRRDVARVIDDTTPTHRRLSWRWLAPVAAAASVALFVLLWPGASPTPIVSTNNLPPIEVAFTWSPPETARTASLIPLDETGVAVRFEPPDSLTSSQPADPIATERAFLLITVGGAGGSSEFPLQISNSSFFRVMRNDLCQARVRQVEMLFGDAMFF